MKEDYQKAVICGFLQHYGRSRFGSPLQVTRWPDEENRLSKDVDAVVETLSPPLAIEHTSVDTMHKQRADDRAFSRVIVGLEEELVGKFSGTTIIGIESGSVPRRGKHSLWNGILRDWLVRTLPSLPVVQQPVDSTQCWFDIEDIPFRVYVAQLKSTDSDVRVARGDNGRRTEPDDIVESIAGNKLAKLAIYKERQFRTILLVENRDISVTNEGTMRSLLLPTLEKCGNAGAADEVWYVDTSRWPATNYYRM